MADGQNSKEQQHCKYEHKQKRSAFYLDHLASPHKRVPRTTRWRWNKELDAATMASCFTNSEAATDDRVSVSSEAAIGDNDRTRGIVASDNGTSSSSPQNNVCSDEYTEIPDNEMATSDYNFTMEEQQTVTDSSDESDDSGSEGVGGDALTEPEVLSDCEFEDHSMYLDRYADDSDRDDGQSSDCDRSRADENFRDCSDSIEENFPIYQGAPITIAASLLLIVSFAMRHSLSGEALSDLLVLIELHCLVPNLCKRSLKLFREFFKSVKTPLEQHHYCPKCYTYFGSELVPECRNCKVQLDDKVPYFIIIPIVEQLSTLLSREGKHSDLQYRHNRNHTEHIEDVLDGKLYKKHFQADGFFIQTDDEKKNHELHVSFQINFDGVALFRSSKFSVWPVYIVMNELPPQERYQRKNRILIGVWFGKEKPHCRTFLQPFAQQFKQLYRKGVVIDVGGVKRLTVRGILLSGVFDAPARCLFTEFCQFNGFYGCPFCTSPGATVKTSERGHTHAYPFDRSQMSGHGEPRTHEQTIDFAKTAAEMRKPYKGVKHFSWALTFPKFDIIRGIAVDYMHGVCIGVVKMLVNLWTDKTYKDDPWYIGDKISSIDKSLLNISPPSFITRVPRSLAIDLPHWKASEYRSFLLYYSVPLLWHHLPDIYFTHYCLLVEGIFRLLKNSISIEDIQSSELLLKHFCLKLGTLYLPRYETSNAHMLLHLVSRVQDLGPLWANSCFYFEDFNGELRNFVHGTQSIEGQIVSTICMQQHIPTLESMIKENVKAHKFYTKLSSGRKVKENEEISFNIYSVGAYSPFTPTGDERIAINNVLNNISNLFKYKRVLLNRKIIHSIEYKSVTRRNNYTVNFKDVDGLKVGQVLYYVKCILRCPNPVFCSDVCICKRVEHLAVINQFEELKEKFVCDSLSHCSIPHIKVIDKGKQAVVAIPVSQINEVMVFVDTLNKDCNFVCHVPNTFEKD